ncbi:translocation/assembly module TamB domain-containing protein [Aquimarina sp. 2201CG5-10]|uniref:translocation/assembly module TamB domain-containing protein n=1 Tax=Aquimarina callyspongiae TaxID=3098150 RepID=UPI002AB53773|nr:translocation/assembly module TamB domain-containing protein [Aquimarina sp. 2201CG5-10]MDY8138437.1 translocation/assembly module TamB domain-containing protein [Aquimarina sp. 2201CG5-10]
MILFSIPGVQTFFGKRITNYLNDEYGVDVAIKRIGLTYSGNVNLKEVLVKDHHKDTLLYAGSIETSILNLRKISKGNPELGTVSIDHLTFDMKMYKGEKSDNLMTFIRKFDTGQKESSGKKFVLTTRNIAMTNSQFSFIDENLNNPNVVIYDDLTLDAESLVVDGDDIYVNIDALSFKDQRGLNVSRLQTCFAITPTTMKFQELVIETKDSKIEGEVLFSYKPGGLDDFENKVNITADFSQAKISTNDLIPFYREFGRNQDIILSNTLVKGTLNDFKVINSDIRGLDRSIIKGDIRIRNALKDPTEFKLDGTFENLTTNYYDLINLLPRVLGTSLPKELYQFGSVKAIGNVIVTPNDVDVDMDLFSQLGKINAFVLLGELEGTKKPTYNGTVISYDFNIGQLLGKESLGNAAFDIQVDGNGFTLKDLDTKIEGYITKLEFNGYNYTNLTVIGNLKDPVFDGKLTIYDPNVQFAFNGVADLSEEINNYDFVAKVDHIDFNKLKLFTRDDISVFNGDVIMNMKGTGINDLFGTISFEKTLYKNQNASYYFEDFDITSSFDDEGVRTITMNSPDIIDGNVKGVFRFENVYDLFRNSIGSLYTNFEPTEITDNEFMEFNFNIYNKIVDVFFPDIQFAPNTFIKGKVESNDSEFKLTFKSPAINAFGNYMDNVDIQVDNKNPLFNTYIAVDSIDTEYYDVSKFSLINVTLKDTLFMRSEFKGGKNNVDDYNLEFYHTINEDNNSVVGFRKSDFKFKGYTWRTNQEKSKAKNKIIFDNDFQNIDIQSIILNHKGEEISVNGKMIGKDYKDIKATFKDVDLNKITPYIEGLRLDGKVDGDLAILQDKGAYFPSSTIVINDLAINSNPMGELRLNASGNETLTQYKINTRLLNNDNIKTLSAIGTIDVSDTSSQLDIDVDLEKLNMIGFSDLGGIVISDIRGYVSGNAKISGSYNNPSMDGELRLQKAGLKVPYLNVDLDFEENAKVLLDKQRFNFDYFNITDTKYNTNGILGGYIAHQRFSKWELGLELLAQDRLLVLDTKEEEESLYYGTAFISGEATIKGPTDELVIDVMAETKEGTVFKIPLNETESLGDNSFIHFFSPEEKQARLEGKEIVLDEIKGLELNFDLDVNNNALVEIVVDKKTGSSLKGRGAGILRIEINTNGKFNMWGDFVAYEGSYNFRYGALLEKVFSVKTGGTINWDGSPTRAVLDLSAVYKTEANPAILLDNAAVNRKIPVEVVVDLQGELIQPNLNFNINFPNVSSVVKSELEYKLNDQSTKELQALSLVSQGQFYSGNLNANNITGSLVAERASSLVSDIFSDEDDKFKVGLNYVQGYRTPDQENADEFGLTVSTQINNRILINGSVGVPVGGVSESVVVGDVEVEYLFNEDGSLRGKIFNRQNEIQYIGEAQGYKQGLGISYSVDFDNFKELKEKIFKKKVKDTVTKPKDTTKIDTPDFINFTDKNN